LCNLSFKVEEFINYLQENSNNWWVNLDVKRSKWGKIYTDKNDWKKEEATKAPTGEDLSEMPF
jgi:hypothetical protein